MDQGLKLGQDPGPGQGSGSPHQKHPGPAPVAKAGTFIDRSRMKNLLMVLVALIVLISAGLAGGTVLERNRQIREMKVLRQRLQQTRFSVDSCRVALAQEEQAFLRFDRVVDSLRNRVEEYEDPSLGGVPQAEYQAYLQVFEAYNDSIPVWEARADSLQASEAVCRALVERHNLLSDSIRQTREQGPG